MKLASGHLKALLARGLDEQVILDMQLHSQPPKSGFGDGALVIPFIRNGTIVRRKFRTFGKDKKFWQDKDGVKCFWNEDCLRDPDLKGLPLIITEGELDAPAAIMAGYSKSVSVPDGAPSEIITAEDSPKYSYLTEAIEMGLLSMTDCPEIILAVDNDGPGANLFHDLSVRLGRARCKFVTYPLNKPEMVEARDGRARCKDLGEVLEDYGVEGVRQVIKGAHWLRVDGVYRMSELPPVPEPVRYEIDMPLLDENMKIRLGDLIVLTGIPSMGKSTFADDLINRIVLRYGVRVGQASFEQNPQIDHKRNKRTWFNKQLVIHQSPMAIARADAWIDEKFVFIYPGDDDDVTLDWLLDKAEACVIQHDVRILVVDPWNEMDHARERDETVTEYTGRAIKAFRRFARKFRVAVILVAHPTKLKKDDNGQYKPPTLYDISDSAHWYNKADVGIVVHREDDISTIRVAKSRYHDDIGRPGAVSAMFVPSERRFDIVARID